MYQYFPRQQQWTNQNEQTDEIFRNKMAQSVPKSNQSIETFIIYINSYLFQPLKPLQ